MKYFILIALFIGLAWRFIANMQETWLGFYYPEGSFGSTIYSTEFKTKEQCISWAENYRKSRPQDYNIHPQDLYECGKNCKVSDDYKYLLEHDPEYTSQNPPTYICKVTFDGGDWRRGDYGE